MAARTKAADARTKKHRPDNREAEVRPAHYRLGNGKEVIEVIDEILLSFIAIKGPLIAEEAGKLFCLGNAIKYYMRHGKKPGATTDIQKMERYLEIGCIDPRFWRDVAVPVMNYHLDPHNLSIGMSYATKPNDVRRPTKQAVAGSSKAKKAP